MNTFLLTITLIAMLLVVVVLVIGMVAMVKGGEFNTKYGNKLMQARVILQGVALGFIAIAFMATHGS
tara:strand:- start:562 stop:762 length:201 start_codon:yes stop_codon:yes gene_type:complete